MVEQIITLAKEGTLASRRRIIAELPNEPLVIDKLINEIAARYGDRNSGYTRVIEASALGPVMRPPSSSSSSSSNRRRRRRGRRTSEAAREGGPVRYARTGRI